MPARCVRAGRLRRGVPPPWARRWGARMSRGYGVRRRVKSSVRRMLCANIGRTQNGRRPLEKTVEPAVSPGVKKAIGTPGAVGSIEAAMDPRTVWVNGAVGEPEVVGPAGSVWVTVSGKEELDNRSSPSCERKGRPGTLGHESILELWLKMQAMRVASGCWEGSRVELHPVPAGEGPVEKGIPGRASWVETSRDGVTGPWVRGHTRTFPRASRPPTARGIGAGCERVSIFCRQGQAGKTPPAVGRPQVVENIGCAASGSWQKRQTDGVPEAIEWSQVLNRARTGDVRECGGTYCLCEEGQSVQVSGTLATAEYGHMLWEREQIEGGPDAFLVLPRAMEDETTSHGGPGVWQRRQEVEDIGSRAIPGLRTMGQLVGVPCAREEEARCGGDPGSWGAAQAAELSACEEQEIGSRGAQGLWGVDQAMGAPRALGKEADDASAPGLLGSGHVPTLQPVVVSGDREEETSYDVSGLWERQQAQGAPLAEPLPGPVMEEIYSGNCLSLWEKRQATREQEAQEPAALGIPGAVDQDVRWEALSCPCGRRRAVGLIEAVVPKHGCATEGGPAALGVPAALWVCQESSSTDGVNLQGRTHVACGRPMAPEECSSVIENTKSGTLQCSWGRRPSIGVSLAPEIHGSLKIEAGSRSFSGLSERRQTVGIPVTTGVSPAGVGVALRASSSVWEHSCRRASDSGGRPPTKVSMAVGLPESMGDETLCERLQRRSSAVMPVAARIPTTVGEPTVSGLFGPHRVMDRGCGESLGIWQRRQMTEVPTAASVPKLEREAGFKGISDLWRRHSETVPEAAREASHQEMIAGVGVSMVRHVPAAVWVTGPSGEEANEGVSDLTVVRRLSTEGIMASGEDTMSRRSLGLVGRGQAVEVPYPDELGARMWGSPRSTLEETTYENIPRVSAIRTTVRRAVSGEEVGLGHFRDTLQGSGERAVGGIPEARGTMSDSGEMGEGGLRATFQ